VITDRRGRPSIKQSSVRLFAQGAYGRSCNVGLSAAVIAVNNTHGSGVSKDNRRHRAPRYSSS